MKQHLSHHIRLFCMIMAVCTMLSCGLTAFAAESPPEAPKAVNTAADELYPTDVQTIIEDGKRQVIKIYNLSAEDNPVNISRESFELDGWRYTLTDITEQRTGRADVKEHIEIVELNTESKDINEIIGLLSPTLDYQKYGYSGLLTLDLTTVKCKEADVKNSSYTISAIREYSDLPANDPSYIPKTITDNGYSLVLDSVAWEVQSSIKAGYSDIPNSYKAIVKYKGTAYQSVVSGYATTAEYIGEITKEAPGDVVYTAFFVGEEIEIAPTEESSTANAAKKDSDSVPIATFIGIGAIVVLLSGAAAFFFLRHNVKIFSILDDGTHILVAKVRISAKSPTIDLTPLNEASESRCFRLEIDQFSAKGLNGTLVDVVLGPVRQQHKIAYEGNLYRIEADFHEMTIRAIYG